MAKPKDPVYGAETPQTIPHPDRFPGSDTPAGVLALANGRKVDMSLNDTNSAHDGDAEFNRNCSYY